MKCEKIICLECRGSGCKACTFTGTAPCKGCDPQGECNPKNRDCSVQKLLKMYPKVQPPSSRKNKTHKRAPQQ